MNDDPVVQILREAAARGRQLRLARDRSTQDQARLNDEALQTPSLEPEITTAQPAQSTRTAQLKKEE
jgi:hypothetical protein